MIRERGKLAVVLTGMVAVTIGCIVLARIELDSLRNAFETDARIVHRLLSQRIAQQDAVMAMLMLLQPTVDAGQRVTSVYPQILGVEQRSGDQTWPDARLQQADTASRQARHAVVSDIDFANGRYRLLQATATAGYVVLVDLQAMVPQEEWPMPRDTSPVRVSLEYNGQRFVIQPGDGDKGRWWFDFRKHLAGSQPFEVVASRDVHWTDLPWLKMLAWSLLTVAALAALLALERQRAERRRAEELLRLGQVARLNTLGELAAGMAHELNQPLTAVLANTQAAGRLLNDDPPELATARDAMQRAAEQARRAADVVGRLRRVVERPEIAGQLQPVRLETVVRNALDLLEPELRRLDIKTMVNIAALTVLADPVGLEQIIHNLLTNALQALAQMPSGERTLRIESRVSADQAVLSVTDSGPGITSDALPRLFEPFFTTRDGGLGLGLSLCESLASGMGGALRAANHAPRGAVFTLQLPLAPAA